VITLVAFELCRAPDRAHGHRRILRVIDDV